MPKRATDTPVRSITLSANQRSLLGTHVDLGQRFGADHQFGARINLSAEDGRVYDGADRRLAAAQIALDYRGDRFRAVLDAGYTRRTSSPLFNHWLLQAGAALPPPPDPKVHPKPSWEMLEVRQPFALLSTEWDFADNWTAYARFGKLRETAPERRYIDQTTINGLGQVSYSSASSLLWTQSNQVADVGVRGSFSLGATKHKLALSAVSQRQQLLDMRSQSLPLPQRVVGSIYTPNLVPNPFAFGVPVVQGVDSPALDLDSLAVADTISAFDDRLFVTLGARHQRIRKLPYDQSKTTPTVAALYKFDNGISVYGNYAESLAQGAVAPAGARNAGEQLAPYLSRQHEFGLAGTAAATASPSRTSTSARPRPSSTATTSSAPPACSATRAWRSRASAKSARACACWAAWRGSMRACRRPRAARATAGRPSACPSSPPISAWSTTCPPCPASR